METTREVAFISGPYVYAGAYYRRCPQCGDAFTEHYTFLDNPYY